MLNTVRHPPGSGSEETAALVAHLQAVRESERVSLARELHDDLGALLVAAVMDIGWAEQHLTSVDQLKSVLRRARTSLAAAIDLKRNMIEVLRPSLLDNFGLFAAFRWHVKQACADTGITCTEHYPEEELKLRPEALSELFRIVQDLLRVTISEPEVKSLDLTVSWVGDLLTIRLAHEHRVAENVDVVQRSASAINAVAHRVSALNGCLKTERWETGTAFDVEFPLADLLRPQ